MDHRLKDVLKRAEAWPEAAREELVEAAEAIEKRLPKRPSGQHEAVFRTLRAADPLPPRTILEALQRAPKLDQPLAPRRGIRVRIRPPVKF